MSADLQAQVVELQTQVAYQEDLLAALNHRVAEQDKELLQLKRMLLALRDSYHKLADSMSESQGENAVAIERPPHY
ncbi:hypothetical protein IMCC21906_02515 [Spongiibacter sp. IMCC21906]|jgi:SlyX protein|uniref:SlyX family protein n=1 Tax=Spongiibacter sp. IMCC21906 TaxID=1620392 RepID=UPI00062DFE44|nr:SlyX family protein [Spongiibacter sp. IMCC21906]AKH70170.1 hypothetical protein IMCC21906_02515 [Spongiibacter sp. IMCC21906]